MGAFDPPILYDKGSYIETDTGNKVSRKASIVGASNIILGGKSIIQNGAILRGDLRRTIPGQHIAITMGRYCVIGENTIIRPPSRFYKGTFTYYPVKMGDFAQIGKNCIIEAATIGSGSEIGDNCIIGKFTVIKDLSLIKPNTVLPENTQVASYTIWAGNPGKMIGTLPETWQEVVEGNAKGFYGRFRSA
ncbi:dynactin 5 [Tremella mesenterica]|uniref:Dynactin subunit 5 n=1 Tax=Tremella mesenterica TaxID=5217 RepID=A0A4Q1BHH3_TREME|nr:dynactin 5 [Tremella mesenterica]